MTECAVAWSAPERRSSACRVAPPVRLAAARNSGLSVGKVSSAEATARWFRVPAGVWKKAALRVSVRKALLASYDNDGIRNGRLPLTLEKAPTRPPLAGGMGETVTGPEGTGASPARTG